MGARALPELFLSAILFGVSAFVAKRVTNTVDGAEVALLRFAIGFLLVVLYSAGRRTPLRPVRWRLLILRGFFGGVAGLLYFLALAELPVGTATLLNCTSPAFAVLFAVIFLQEPLPLATGIALLIAGTGIVLVIYGQGKALGGAYGWQAIALLSAVAAGAAVVSTRAARRTDGPWEIYAVFCLVGMACTVPLGLARWRTPSLAEWGLLLTVGGLWLVGQILMTHALGLVEAATTVTIAQLTVVTAALLGYFIDDDPFTLLSMAGAVLTIVGVVWAARVRARRVSAPPR